MNREEKALVVQSLREGFERNKSAFLVGVGGMTVSQLQSLRKDLRSNNSSLKIAKGRLMKKAVAGLDGVDQLTEFFREQVGLVFVENEAPAVAKVLRNFAKENEALKLVVGYVDNRIYDKKSIERIASIPSREVLLSQLAAVLNAPMAGLARTLNQVVEAKRS
jgi:large subunit ribosomal protein L10